MLCGYDACGEDILLLHLEHEEASVGGETEACGRWGKSCGGAGGGGGGFDPWMGMKTKKKKEDKSGVRELEERCEEIRGRNRGRNVDGKSCLVPQWEACTTATL